MSKHTPGPWIYQKTKLETRAIDRKWEIIAPDPSGGAMVVVGSNTGVDCLNEANAKLIAAAPDLLDALERLRSMCHVLQLEGVLKHVNELSVLTMADKAIAKAKGEE